MKNGGITSAKIASGAVSSDKIASGAVTTSKIANDAVTKEKIASNVDVSDKGFYAEKSKRLIDTDIVMKRDSTGNFWEATDTAGTSYKGIKGNSIYSTENIRVGDTQPSTPEKGHMYIDGNILKYYDGSDWIPLGAGDKYAYTLIVSKDDHGHFTSIQDAINWAESNLSPDSSCYIFIANGTYEERIEISSGIVKGLISENAVIKINDASVKLPALSCASGDKLYIKGIKFVIQNYDTSNTTDHTVILLTGGSSLIAEDVEINGNSLEIEGIYSVEAGSVILNRCTIKNLKKLAIDLHRSGGSIMHTFYIENCRIENVGDDDSDGYGGIAVGSTSGLARTERCYIINNYIQCKGNISSVIGVPPNEKGIYVACSRVCVISGNHIILTPGTSVNDQTVHISMFTAGAVCVVDKNLISANKGVYIDASEKSVLVVSDNIVSIDSDDLSYPVISIASHSGSKDVIGMALGNIVFETTNNKYSGVIAARIAIGNRCHTVEGCGGVDDNIAIGNYCKVISDFGIASSNIITTSNMGSSTTKISIIDTKDFSNNAVLVNVDDVSSGEISISNVERLSSNYFHITASTNNPSISISGSMKEISDNLFYYEISGTVSSAGFSASNTIDNFRENILLFDSASSISVSISLSSSINFADNFISATNGDGTALITSEYAVNNIVAGIGCKLSAPTSATRIKYTNNMLIATDQHIEIEVSPSSSAYVDVSDNIMYKSNQGSSISVSNADKGKISGNIIYSNSSGNGINISSSSKLKVINNLIHMIQPSNRVLNISSSNEIIVSENMFFHDSLGTGTFQIYVDKNTANISISDNYMYGGERAFYFEGVPCKNVVIKNNVALKQLNFLTWAEQTLTGHTDINLEITGNYYMFSDNPSGSAICVYGDTANNRHVKLVTIHLNSISPFDPSADSMQYGVYLLKADCISIFGNTIHLNNSSSGIGVSADAGARVLSNNIDGVNVGISVDSGPICDNSIGASTTGISAGEDSKINSNTVNAGDTGISLESGVCVGNLIVMESGASYGIKVASSGGTGVVVSSNVIRSSTSSTGIYVENLDYCTISENSINGFSLAIDLSNVNYSSISANATESTIQVRSSCSNDVINSNVASQISLGGSNHVCDGNRAYVNDTSSGSVVTDNLG